MAGPHLRTCRRRRLKVQLVVVVQSLPSTGRGANCCWTPTVATYSLRPVRLGFWRSGQSTRLLAFGPFLRTKVIEAVSKHRNSKVGSELCHHKAQGSGPWCTAAAARNETPACLSYEEIFELFQPGIYEWLESCSRLRGEPVVFALPRGVPLVTVSIQKVLELFVVRFMASPGAVPQLLRYEVKPRSGLCVRLDARLPKEDSIGFSSRASAGRELS